MRDVLAQRFMQARVLVACSETKRGASVRGYDASVFAVLGAWALSITGFPCGRTGTAQLGEMR